MINVSMETRINAPAADVWAIIGDFNALPKFIEAATKSSVEGEGTGAVRTVILPDGSALRERLEHYNADAMTVKYSIVDGPLPVVDYLATMVITATENGCELKWSSKFSPNGISEEEARNTITDIYQMGFDGLAKLFG